MINLTRKRIRIKLRQVIHQFHFIILLKRVQVDVFNMPAENAANQNSDDQTAEGKKRIQVIIDATINFKPLPWLPATPTMYSCTTSIVFFDCRRGRRFAGQSQIMLAAQ
jgi:hypothetical protein